MSKKNPKNNNLPAPQQEYYFSGPLPPPEIVEKYDHMIPGAAKTIFQEFEKNLEQRRKVEWYVIQSHTRYELIGMILTFIIVITVISVSTYLITTGRSIEGLTTLIPSLLFYAGSLFYRKYIEDKKQNPPNN